MELMSRWYERRRAVDAGAPANSALPTTATPTKNG